jgi:uncharacterized membrane protein
MAHMDTGYIALITTIVIIVLLLVQRTEKSKRRLTWSFAIMSFLIISHNTFLKSDYHEETLIAFIIGFVVSGLFWLFIGKYNPVGTSDDMKVMGLDD